MHLNTIPRNDDGYATFEHIVPRNRGGTDHESNIVMTHRSCNAFRASRGDKMVADLYRFKVGYQDAAE